MKKSLLIPVAWFVAWMAGASEAHSSGLSIVRPSARAPAPQARSSATPAQPFRDVLEQRIQRSRAFPHHLSSPQVDWSPFANRRRGWAPRPGGLRNPHARESGPVLGLSSASPAAAAAAAANGPPDTVRIAFLRVDFLNDRAGGETTGDGRFDLSGPDTTIPPIDRPPHNRHFYLQHLEALRRYYDAQSYGRVVIEGDVWPRNQDGAYSVSDLADFGPWRFSPDIYRAAVHMFRTMMFAADSQSIVLNDRIPWDSYDRFMLIHAGSDFQSDLRGDSPFDIPSFTLGVSDTDLVIFPDSTNRPIDRAAVVPETANQDGFFGALNGVIAHENGHNIFGFADLYNVDTGFPVVGLWSLMDSGNLAGSIVGLPNGDEIFATGLLPPSLDPFHRFFAGDALHFPEPAWNDTTRLRESERHPDMRRLFLTADEYLVLENRALAPADTIELDQDSTSRVVLGPRSPDRLEYDALIPGAGMVVWHVDASVIPFETAFRVNPDYGYNSNPGRPGISVIEADGLADIGDPGSPFILGSPRDPYFRSNNRLLSDTTIPNLIPHIRTRPHLSLEFLDEPDTLMRFVARKTWQPDGWPVAVDMPPGGPLLMAVDADGDRNPEVCWAGGATDSPDSTALFAVRGDGSGINDTTAVFARLNRRPLPLMAALPLGEPGAPGEPDRGPSLFAVTTQADGPDTSTAGGRVYLIDHLGNVQPGWPPELPAIVTTPPVIAASTIYVGAADGRVYAIGLNGAVLATSATLGAPIAGRLAVDPLPTPGLVAPYPLVAVGAANGTVAVFEHQGGSLFAYSSQFALSGPGFLPDFLWIDFDGGGTPAGKSRTCSAARTLVVHHADQLWALCASEPLPHWGRATGDTIVAGLGAGDPDGDGYAEVLTQSKTSGVAFWNQSGSPAPGWPKTPTRERFETDSPPLAVDVDGNGRGEVVALNASGILAALDAQGRMPDGWPLATGSGAVGAPVAADLDRDGQLEIVAPDRSVPDSLKDESNARFGTLVAFTLPVGTGNPIANSWSMLGGDPGRTSTLPGTRSPIASAAGTGPFVAGSLKAYPNPARNQPVALAYQLEEPADVEITIVDASGHEVAAFRDAGRRADNVAVWDPGKAPAGLYMARLKFRAASREHSEVVLVGVVK